MRVLNKDDVVKTFCDSVDASTNWGELRYHLTDEELDAFCEDFYEIFVFPIAQEIETYIRGRIEGG